MPFNCVRTLQPTNLWLIGKKYRPNETTFNSNSLFGWPPFKRVFLITLVIRQNCVNCNRVGTYIVRGSNFIICLKKTCVIGDD